MVKITRLAVLVIERIKGQVRQRERWQKTVREAAMLLELEIQRVEKRKSDERDAFARGLALARLRQRLGRIADRYAHLLE
ncbi:hypothetical protein [Caballeronia ptereochthonis]|uniref:hypothetical protein n=1 Tax=Caballeronia ptereochthonis TaxID=1777144 RepID=UPI00135C16DF|nr:hypothetical protein [Caballeronia ptereochthonis]